MGLKNQEFKKQIDSLKEKASQLEARNKNLDSKVHTMESHCEQHTGELKQIQQTLQAKVGSRFSPNVHSCRV